MRRQRLGLIISVPTVCFMSVKGRSVPRFHAHAAVRKVGRFLASEVKSQLSADRFCLGKHARRPLNNTKHLLMK